MFSRSLFHQRPGIIVRAVALCALLSLIALATMKAGASRRAQDETISICAAPPVLPRDQPLTNYSPALCFDYSGLKQESYSLRVFLLERSQFNCASGQWCGTDSQPPAVFTINNSNGANAAGRLLVVRNMDVFNHPNFRWVADLYNQAGQKVDTALQDAAATTLRPPLLNPVGDRSGPAGQPLEFSVSATAPTGTTAGLSAEFLPTGATFDEPTGRFSWPAPVAGSYQVLFKATLTGNVPLSDAELVTLQIGQTPTQMISLSAATYTTGEGGPAIIIVTRSNGAGVASVQYATTNLTATAGADYTATTGTLNFAAGEASKAVSISINNDTVAEPDETFTFTLSNPINATLGTPANATVTIVDDDTHAVAGQWSGVNDWPVVPIHMHLLPNGKVLFWDRHDHARGWDSTPRLWDPQTGAFTTLSDPGYDLFCSGHAFMADGKLLVTGGHIPMPPPNDSGVGEDKASLFDFQNNSWTALPAMNAGRWYPSNVTLANGDVLTLAGTTVNVNTVNPLPQVWQAASLTWRTLTGAPQGNQPGWADFYPYLYLAPDGRVFAAGPQQMARYLDTAGAGAWTNVASSSLVYRDYGSSVLYDDGKVLIVGGNARDPNENAPTILPSHTAEVINLNVAQPAWRAVAPMSVGRRHHTATLLPDGKVLVTGGSALPGFDNEAGAVKFAEQWDPAHEAWQPLAGYTRYRGYHSNALLLPDGRVLVAGGGHPDPPGGTAQPNSEIYSPPYLFKGARPTITNAPAQLAYGQTFAVQTPDAASIAGVTLLRLGSVTHAFNQNQRINRLSFTAAGGALNVVAPANANLCPPGHYLLFVLNNNGVPSVARVVQIGQVTCPTVSGLNPTSGTVGSTVTINGANFTGVLAVKFAGNVAAQFNLVSDAQITAMVPSGAVTGPLTISKPACPDAQTGVFTITPGYEADVAPRPHGSNNGMITIADAVLVGRFVAGLDMADGGSEFQRADCAPRATLGDGRLTVADWTQAGRYAAALDPVVLAGGPMMPATTSPPPALRHQPSLTTNNRSTRLVRAVTADSATGRPLTATRVVTLELNAHGDEHALGFSLRFNPAQWRLVSAKAGRDAQTATLLVNTREAAQGRLGWALALPAGQTFGAGARQLVVLTLAVRSVGQPALALSFGDAPVAREIVDAKARALRAGYTLAGDVRSPKSRQPTSAIKR